MKNNEIHNTENVFCTGFSRVEYSPNHPTPLGGFGNAPFRQGNNVMDPVCASCLAVKDAEGNKALLYTCDLISIELGITNIIKEMVKEKFGIPGENVFISATHTHAAPATYGRESCEGTALWLDKYFYPAMEKSAREALSDLDKTEIFIGRKKIEHTNFVRRYATDQGKWASITGGGGKPIVHESNPDNTMQLIKFERENQKDILMVNWQAHPCFNCGAERLDISADYPGQFRVMVEKEFGCHCGFWEGAAGNLVTRGRLENEYPYETAELYGEKLKEELKLLIDSGLTPVKSGTVKGIAKTVTLQVNHTRDDERDNAYIVFDLYVKQGKLDEAREAAKKYGFESMYDARDVYQRSNMGKTRNMEIYALSFGDLGFAGAPYEMFDTNGFQIKFASPFEMTFMCELTNGSNSYIPSLIAYGHGGYEVTSCIYAPGTGEKLAGDLVEMLKNLKES